MAIVVVGVTDCTGHYCAAVEVQDSVEGAHGAIGLAVGPSLSAGLD